MRPSTRAAFALILGALSSASNQAQTTAQAQTIAGTVPRSFDVASIKPNQTGSDSRRAGTSPGGRFTATNVSLKLLISRAFGVPESQIERGPGWIETEKYDIAARAATSLEMSREEVRPCLQALLAERFRLKFHRETKQCAVLSLGIAKNGPKLTEHSGEGASGISASSGSGKAVITGTKATMARLAEYLSGQAGRPVIDNTGLKGEYDFRLEWSTEEASGSSEPSIFAALQEQLGLKLAAAKGLIEMIVIDGAERASAN
jgi:uncharacterized protein (TIGR03435 family)